MCQYRTHINAKCPVILLDKPFNNFDIWHKQSLMQFLKQHKAQFNVVMVLHDLDRATSYADHIILMQQGKIITQGMCKISYKANS